jgi:hypothetical protein
MRRNNVETIVNIPKIAAAKTPMSTHTCGSVMVSTLPVSAAEARPATDEW